MKFISGFSKVAAVTMKGLKPATLDKAGLLALGVPVAYHGYKSLKEKDYTGAGMAATEGAGLGMLYRAVQKAHG
jgi:hypothetical protein